MSWGSALPIFRVASLRASLAYYVEVLGFEIDWEYPEIASISRDRCTIFLCQADQTSGPAWAWIGLQDLAVEALHEQLLAKGARIRQGPTNFDWAMEMQVTDLDNNVLRIGSDPKPDQPRGPFLDALGHEWTSLPDAGWELQQDSAP